MRLPSSERAILIRTDFSDESAWQSVRRAATEPGDPFTFDMEVVDASENCDATFDQLLDALPEDYPHSFFVVADRIAISERDHPLLVVDLGEEHGRTFRSIAAQVAAIESNLSIANMGFEEFANAVGADGIFRGFAGA